VCNKKDAAQKKAVKVMLLVHEVIMEEAGKRDRLEYDVVIGHGILAGKYLAEYRDSLK